MVRGCEERRGNALDKIVKSSKTSSRKGQILSLHQNPAPGRLGVLSPEMTRKGARAVRGQDFGWGATLCRGTFDYIFGFGDTKNVISPLTWIQPKSFLVRWARRTHWERREQLEARKLKKRSGRLTKSLFCIGK